MALPTSSIGSLNDLLAIKDQLTSSQVTDIKHHLLNKKTMPSTFFSDIASLRNQRAHDLLSETEHQWNDSEISVRFVCCVLAPIFECVCPGCGENDVKGYQPTAIACNNNDPMRNPLKNCLSARDDG